MVSRSPPFDNLPCISILAHQRVGWVASVSTLTMSQVDVDRPLNQWLVSIPAAHIHVQGNERLLPYQPLQICRRHGSFPEMQFILSLSARNDFHHTCPHHLYAISAKTHDAAVEQGCNLLHRRVVTLWEYLRVT